uniref:CCDC116 n=1 Tax=Macrostomum lignano TaxID=282301 RepID=A0A1I8FSX2_9PLAT
PASSRSQRQQPLLCSPKFPDIAPSVRQVKSGELNSGLRQSSASSGHRRLPVTLQGSHDFVRQRPLSKPQVLQQLPSHSSSRGSRLGFHRLLHSEHQAAVEEQINSTLSLVKSCRTALEEILDDFQNKCEQLGSRQGDQSLLAALPWTTLVLLLKEMARGGQVSRHPPPQSHSLLSGALMKNVHSQLSDLGSHKVSPGRPNLRPAQPPGPDGGGGRSQLRGQRLQEFNELYGSYASDKPQCLKAVLRSANRTKEELYGQHLPGMLQIQKQNSSEPASASRSSKRSSSTATNALTGALESHCYLRMS